MIHPLILKQKGSVLTISGETLQQLLADPKPVLWCNDGLYGMVPIERVRNAASLAKDKRISKWSFTWSEVVEIPQETGRVMEKYNGGWK